MNTPTLTKIIEDWIGEDKFNHLDPDWLYNQGNNDALADLRARVPELVEKIASPTVAQIEQLKADLIARYNHPDFHSDVPTEFYQETLYHVQSIINSLTSE